METPERPDRSLPSPWTPPATPPVPAPAAHAGAAPYAWDEPAELDAPTGRALTPKLVVRAVRRYWWQILLLWGVGSAVLGTLAYTRIRPTYEAIAWLKVEPTTRSPLGSTTGDGTTFMQTQLQLITSPDVLGTVVQDPRVAGSPSLATPDPETTLRRSLRVTIPDKTSLILIAMATPYPNEAKEIVNAVARAYLRSSTEWLDSSTREHIQQLREYKDRFATEADALRKRVDQLTREGVDADPRNSTQEALNTYRTYKARHDQIKLELIDAEATVRMVEALRRQSGRADEPVGPVRLTGAALDAAVREAFKADPEVVALHREMIQVKQQLEAAGRLSQRAGSDPAVVKFQRDLDRLNQQNNRLWLQREPALRQQIARGDVAAGPVDPIARELETARTRLGKLQLEEAEVAAALDRIRINTEAEGNKTIEARIAQEDLAYAREMYRKMTTALESLEMEAHGPAKVTLIAEGQASAQPTSDRRAMVALVTPFGVLAAVLGLFVLLELRGARVADPDELASRLRLGVIGIVPPLPSLAAPGSPKAIRDQRRKLEEFVQSLDHLRVTLCAAAGTAAGRRCVLITSAVGGEGKTTLAAQLAGRCANAGLTTLLVDADLRRPSLGELLEVPEGPGLAEVLLEECRPEDAMVVIGNAGGFHLLPAGSGGHDPSRLLQGERLGQLIARLREAFDVVLIDAPPVLPVPDALLIGRWTDGAIVAVRHDSSRFPLVERAQKRLTSIGVPLLGAVVNGVRPAESSYGAYDYYASTATGGDRV
jgi:capsular exopolysaccharide synthesis family protein